MEYGVLTPFIEINSMGKARNKITVKLTPCSLVSAH